MAWKISIGEASMMLDDLTPDDFVGICDARDERGMPKYPSLNWLGFYRSPALNPSAFYDLLVVVARKLEVPTPPRPVTLKEAAELVYKSIKDVDDDLPTEFGDDGLPLEEADDQETT